jgi:hypothetical protein
MQRRKVYVAIGVDCDPDRDTYPFRMTWRGVEAIARLFDLPDVHFTLNIRADSQIQDYFGSAAFCRERFDSVWTRAESRGHALAWHLHYFDRCGRQDVSEANIRRNIELGAAALPCHTTVHMGWTYQSDVSLRALAEAGVEVDYSPVPRLRFAGRGGVDRYDWSGFGPRPQRRCGIRMVPAFSYRDRILRRHFRTERVLLTTTTHPRLFNRLTDAFFESGSDFLVSYFHADEIAGAVGGWRDRLYGLAHLRHNIRALRERADREGHEIEFVTIPRLAGILFDEDHGCYA